jgi:NRAMP (natural resistance-associated macrophage protein)-like metal ion transporter
LKLRAIWIKVKNHPLSKVGPGWVTGVADDDPSGIVTYSQAGAQFGLNMLWTMPITYPLMATIQLLCAQIGRVTGRGLAANIKSNFSPLAVFFLVLLLLIANVLNIAADIAAMGEVAQLVTGINWHVMTVFFALITLSLQIFVPYHRYVFFLKWLTLSLLAYAAVLFTVHVPWGEVLLSTFMPKLILNSQAAAMVVGIFGTTISPYLFFWQASQEVEEMNIHSGKPLLMEGNDVSSAEMRRIKWDTWSGMFYSNIAAYFIILATGVTLHVTGVTDITTAAQAAEALRPLAGEFAFLLFALGILAVGLIAVPVLAGSAAYALSEVLGWRSSLEDSAMQGKKFYLIISISVLGALGIQYLPINPMKALFWSAVINGVAAVPLMVAILILAARTSVMGSYTASRASLALGWLATGIMGVAAGIMFLS